MKKYHDDELLICELTANDVEKAAEKSGIERYNAKLNFTDIQKITYGKKVIFEATQNG